MKTEGEIEGAMRAFGVSRQEAETVSYLGDGVYATFDGYQVTIRTFDGCVASRPIVLEPPVMRSLVDYASRHSAVSA
jgi:hypothetical protein